MKTSSNPSDRKPGIAWNKLESSFIWVAENPLNFGENADHSWSFWLLKNDAMLSALRLWNRKFIQRLPYAPGLSMNKKTLQKKEDQADLPNQDVCDTAFSATWNLKNLKNVNWKPDRLFNWSTDALGRDPTHGVGSQMMQLSLLVYIANNHIPQVDLGI